MTGWRDALRHRLANDGGVLNLVGPRVRHSYRPQDTELPAVTFFGVDTRQMHTLTEADGLPEVRVQVDSWWATAESAAEVAEAVRLCLDGYRGAMTPSVFVQALLMSDGGREDYEPPQSGQTRGVHRVSQDFRLAYDESIPTF
jgi:hypothetical protein